MATTTELKIAALQARMRELHETRKTEVFDPAGLPEDRDALITEIARRLLPKMPGKTPEACQQEVLRRLALSRALNAEYDQAKAELEPLRAIQADPNGFAALSAKRLEEYRQHIKQFPQGAPAPAPAEASKAKGPSPLKVCKTIGKLTLTALAMAAPFAFVYLVWTQPQLLLLLVLAVVGLNQVWISRQHT
jgi:hypothetical protein